MIMRSSNPVQWWGSRLPSGFQHWSVPVGLSLNDLPIIHVSLAPLSPLVFEQPSQFRQDSVVGRLLSAPTFLSHPCLFTLQSTIPPFSPSFLFLPALVLRHSSTHQRLLKSSRECKMWDRILGIPLDTFGYLWIPSS